MASSLAAQLSQIAANSTNQLNLKAQRVAHSQSLIFGKRVAGSQDFDTIYDICYDGFREICQLDARFAQFERSLFSEQSKSQERTEMSAEQNKELDTVLEAFLALVGGRLLLNPAVKAVEWLVRRFRYDCRRFSDFSLPANARLVYTSTTLSLRYSHSYLIIQPLFS
jgi:U3 small nucleolar RNA-associated protein 10